LKRIGVLPNISRDPGLRVTKSVIAWLRDNGCEPLIAKNVGDALGLSDFSHKSDEIYETSELLVVLGGDGTILSVARNAAKNNTPLLGINIGTLGYLTDVDAPDAFGALEHALNGDYVTERRMMLEASVSYDVEPQTALNDVCVLRGGFSTMLTMYLDINGEYIGHYRADGLIVSTPTGSTAYNLSAGGPVLKPDSEMIAITPICAHMLYAKAFVVSAADTVKINVESVRNVSGSVAFDGQNHIPVKAGDVVTVKRSTLHTEIIKTTKKSFYSILRHKMEL
jgi:NAD+ kinase